MDLLTEASVDLDHGFAPQLTRRKRELLDALAERRGRQDRVLERDSFGPAESDSLGRLLSEMAAIENELNLLESELRTSDPKYARLSAPSTLAAREIMALIDPGSVLLQYALGEPRSYASIVRPNSIHGVELASRTTIETAAKRAYESMKAPSVNDQAAVRDLARLVLEPVAEWLGSDTLLVAADGALHYIPFSVLPLGSERAPLITSREVTTVPSISVLAAQRERRQPGKNAKTLAVFADPVFDETDARLLEVGLSASVSPAEPHALVSRLSLGMQCSGGRCETRGGVGRLTRLAASGHEAQAIADLVPDPARFVASGLNATREAFLDADFSQFRVVHIATHGLVDSQYPALSSLALSRFDGSGREVNPFLRLDDIYNLNLNAELVVLSACETALGGEIRGEGLVGLTQGFLYAGAQSLVVSLWQVPDAATAQLMQRFYAAMFRDGRRPAEALRSAQLAIAAERRWSHPFYWGAFTLLGESR